MSHGGFDGDPDPYNTPGLGTDGNSDAEIRRAGAVVIDHVPMGGWLDNPEQGTWGVLDALFRPVGRTRYHGTNVSPEYAAARSRWLTSCRDWVESATGRVLTSTHVPIADQRAYAAATGNVWVPPVDAAVVAERERAVAEQARAAFGAFDRRQPEPRDARRHGVATTAAAAGSGDDAT